MHLPSALPNSPNLIQHPLHPPPAPLHRHIPHHVTSLLQPSPKLRIWTCDRAADEIHPHQRALEVLVRAGDELESAGKTVEELDHLRLVLIEARHEGAEVDAGSKTEAGGDGGGDRPRIHRTVGVAKRLVCFRHIDLVRKGFDVLTQVDIGEKMLVSEVLEADNLGDEIHHSVIAAHEFAETGGLRGEVFFTVCVGETGGAAEHGGAEDVNPGGEGHVEGWGALWGDGEGVEVAGEVEFVDEGDGGLEVLVPGDVGEVVVDGTDSAL